MSKGCWSLSLAQLRNLKTKTKMEKKLKQVSEGQGFVCANLEEKKRIWQKLTDAGYPMHFKFEDANENSLCILFYDKGFLSSDPNKITDPLNESDFFDDWTPQAGEWVEVFRDGKSRGSRQYLCTIDGNHLVVCNEKDYKTEKTFIGYYDIRQIKPETMTLQEVRDALGKPNLVIE
jgi:hypothetical protein